MILTALTLDDVTKEVRQHRWRREEVPGRSPGHASVEGEGKEEALTKETGSSRQWGRRESRGHGILESTGRTGLQEEGTMCSGHASLRETSRWPGPLHLLPPGSNALAPKPIFESHPSLLAYLISSFPSKSWPLARQRVSQTPEHACLFSP